MDFGTVTAILAILFGGTSVVSIIVGIIYRKENKELKKNEVKASSAEVEGKEIDNDDKQIDLGKKFMEQSLAMTKQVQDIMMETNKLRNEQYEQQKMSMDELITRMGGVETKLDSLSDRVTSIEEWGNGDLSAFREAHRHAY